MDGHIIKHISSSDSGYQTVISGVFRGGPPKLSKGLMHSRENH